MPKPLQIRENIFTFLDNEYLLKISPIGSQLPQLVFLWTWLNDIDLIYLRYLCKFIFSVWYAVLFAHQKRRRLIWDFCREVTRLLLALFHSFKGLDLNFHEFTPLKFYNQRKRKLIFPKIIYHQLIVNIFTLIFFHYCLIEIHRWLENMVNKN